jgi:hypothetical protein
MNDERKKNEKVRDVTITTDNNREKKTILYIKYVMQQMRPKRKNATKVR